MERKQLIWIGVFIGSTLGGLVPGLWGEGMFSLSSVIASTIGGLLGIYVAFKLGS
jgi:hypothetical protein